VRAAAAVVSQSALPCHAYSSIHAHCRNLVADREEQSGKNERSDVYL
jgi:hypothetical protein